MNRNYNNLNGKLIIKYQKSMDYNQVIKIAVLCSAVGVITTKVCDAIEKKRLAKKRFKN